MSNVHAASGSAADAREAGNDQYLHDVLIVKLAPRVKLRGATAKTGHSTGRARTEHIAKPRCSNLPTPCWGVDWSQMVEQIRKHLENGFTPFALRLSDGRRFVVPHRDFVAISPKVVVVIGEDELAVSINPLHIVSVEDVMPAR